jgi:hypothetical protein
MVARDLPCSFSPSSGRASGKQRAGDGSDPNLPLAPCRLRPGSVQVEGDVIPARDELDLQI